MGSANMDRLQVLEQKLAYTFSDLSLLRQALTHSSYANECSRHKVRVSDNERLEFLGDAVLELVTSEFIYDKHKKMPEGKLSKLRAAIVCEPSLAACAVRIGIGEHLLLGKGEDATGGRERDSILSDAFEAILGAIYLDGGFEPAKSFVYSMLLKGLRIDELFRDNKTVLQEMTQKYFQCTPQYTVIREDGPPHARIFTVEVSVSPTLSAVGVGTSKKNAEQKAAFAVIQKIREQNGGQDVSKEH